MFKSKTKQLANSFLADAKGIWEEAKSFCSKMSTVRSDAGLLAGMTHKRCAVVIQ